MVDENEKSPQERQRDKTLKLIDQDQLKEVGDEFPEVDEESEDLEPSEFTSTKPDSEPTVKDERFSKEHEIDEKALRKNKQRNASSGGNPDE